MRVRNHRDFWSGAMFVAIGVLFAVLSQDYKLGTAARMGPGFFPTMLGSLLALLGLAIAWRSTAASNAEARIGRVGWRELLLVLLSISVFSATLPQFGLVVSVTLLIAISAFASHEFRWKETAISIVVLLVMSELVFVRGLELQIPVLPKFLSP